jgi:cytochrome c biogenesis protein CcdA
LFAGCWLMSALYLDAAPRIVSFAPVHDFGDQLATASLTHTFVIENRGDSELVLGRIHACCGATARLDSNAVAPGEQATLHVTLSLAGRKGPQTKNLFVASNDPAAPLFRLTMRSNVMQDANEQPSGTGSGDSLAKPSADDTEVVPPLVRRMRDGGVAAPGLLADGAEFVSPAEDAGKVIVDYFHEPGCPACRRIESRVLPEVLEAFGQKIDLRKWNVSEMQDVIRLMAYQDALGLKEDHPVLMVVDYQLALHGVAAIEGGLQHAVAAALRIRAEPGYAQPVPIAIPDTMAGLARGQSRLDTFSLPAILVAGLVDGLNPCAMTALTFLMSLLAASKVKGRKLMVLGLSYCLAGFLTYLTIGLGLLRAFHLFHALPVVRHVVDAILLAGLLIVAFLSFRDAWRFSRSHSADAVQVKLPKAVMRLSHTLMRKGVKSKHVAVGGFLSGVAVTGVDSICTGQLYIPTLALMIRMADGSQSLRAWQLLLAYNAMFILPLLVVFLLVWTGLSNQTLQEWSKRHVVPGKILMGLLMLVLAAGLLLLRSL